MPKHYDLVGRKFGRLTVIKKSEIRLLNQVTWECLCDCGNYKLARTKALTIGAVRSCGCLWMEARIKNLPSPYINGLAHTKHGYVNHPLFNTWYKMIRRCYNQKDKSYRNYGARGITVCDEWLKSPEEFCNWGISNGYEKGLTLDRIDNDGNYSPNNCRWATNLQQSRNTRNNISITIGEETKCMMEWCEIFGISNGLYSSILKQSKKMFGNSDARIEYIKNRIINNDRGE